MKQVNMFLPEKNIKITSDDSPWCTDRIKQLKRLKCCEYSKHRKSSKWIEMNETYQKIIKQGKQKYYDKVLKDLKQSDPNQWYSKLKRLCSYDLEKQEVLKCEEVDHLEDQQQADALVEHFSSVRCKFDALNTYDVPIPHFEEKSVPHFSESHVQDALKGIKTKKAVPPGDIPPYILKHFATKLANPIANIYNCSMKQGKWPLIWKKEFVTPVAKVFPPKLLKNLRSISGLVTMDKISESLIAKLMVADMKEHIDKAQYGNQKGLSIQHYLVNMIDKILTDVHSNSTEVTAVLANLVDWKLGIHAFIQCGVRPFIIPLLISYFQDRTMVVKWHGKMSKEKKVPGGGPQGGYFGILGFLSQSNSNADCVDLKSRFKFVDDLTTLEKINLLTIGLASFNIKKPSSQ